MFCLSSPSIIVRAVISDGAPGGLFVSVIGFVSEHPRLGLAAPLALLPADFLDARPFRGHLPGLQLFNFVQQEPPGEETIESLLARGLALDLQAGWAVKQHDARGRLVHILTAMSTGPDKGLFDIGLTHSQGGHASGQLLFFFRIHGKRSHARNLAESVANLN
jgi:hypothetical protein